MAIDPNNGLPTGGGYADVIKNDPLYQQMIADLQAQGVADQAQASQARRRALIQFGEVPAFEGLDASLLGQGFLEDAGYAKPLAEANTASGLSTMARINKQHQDNVRALRNMLAARGMYRSGATGTMLREENQAFTRAQYDARQQLLDFMAGVQQGLLNAQRAAAGQQGQALQGAYGRALDAPPPAPAAPVAPVAPVAPPVEDPYLTDPQPIGIPHVPGGTWGMI